MHFSFANRPPNPFIGRNTRTPRAHPKNSNTRLRNYPLSQPVHDRSMAPPPFPSHQPMTAHHGSAFPSPRSPQPMTAHNDSTFPPQPSSQPMTAHSDSAFPPQRSPQPMTMHNDSTSPPTVTTPPIPPMPPNPPPQPLPSPQPKTAAEQFKQINKNLPDGVQYQPLDEETLKLLRTHQQKSTTEVKQEPPTQPPAPELFTTPPPKADPALVTYFKRLIQDERNAHVFYGHLSKLAHRADMEAALSNLSENANECIPFYSEMMTTLCGQTFAPEEKEINTQLDFEHGIALAVAEENKSLRVLVTLLDQVNDNECAQAIQRMINKKMINRNLLSFIKSNNHYPFTV